MDGRHAVARTIAVTDEQRRPKETILGHRTASLD